MQELKIFENKEFGKVRAIEIDNKSYFVGKDVAEILGYAKPLNALATHIDEDDSLKQGLIDSMGRTQETILINESWLYSLILSSKLPKAKQFKHWVTAEVLPSIRKHGAYTTPATPQYIYKGHKVVMLMDYLREICPSSADIGRLRTRYFLYKRQGKLFIEGVNCFSIKGLEFKLFQNDNNCWKHGVSQAALLTPEACEYLRITPCLKACDSPVRLPSTYKNDNPQNQLKQLTGVVFKLNDAVTKLYEIVALNIEAHRTGFHDNRNNWR